MSCFRINVLLMPIRIQCRKDARSGEGDEGIGTGSGTQMPGVRASCGLHKSQGAKRPCIGVQPISNIVLAGQVLSGKRPTLRCGEAKAQA